MYSLNKQRKELEEKLEEIDQSKKVLERFLNNEIESVLMIFWSLDSGNGFRLDEYDRCRLGKLNGRIFQVVKTSYIDDLDEYIEKKIDEIKNSGYNDIFKKVTFVEIDKQNVLYEKAKDVLNGKILYDKPMFIFYDEDENNLASIFEHGGKKRITSINIRNYPVLEDETKIREIEEYLTTLDKGLVEREPLVK